MRCIGYCEYIPNENASKSDFKVSTVCATLTENITMVAMVLMMMMMMMMMMMIEVS